MRCTALTAVLVLGFLTTGAMGQSSVTPPLPANTNYVVYSPTHPPSAPSGDDTIVCNYQQETGSLMISRVCRTLRAWKQMQADAREFMDFQFRGSHQCQSTSCSGHGGG